MGQRLSQIENISSIPEMGLCAQCGMCEAVCPADCIHFVWGKVQKIPIVNDEQCILCGDCLAVCPGRELSADTGAQSLSDKYIGRFDKAMVMKGNRDFINDYTASGGFVTSFLAYLLDKKHVDGVVNVCLNGGDPRGAKSQLVTDSSELRNSTGSVYYAVPLGPALKEISKRSGTFAVVGLPCQIRGINKLREFDEYKDRISVTISLFCGFMTGIHASEYLLSSLRIPEGERIDRISFRAKRDDRDGFLVETEKGEYFVARGDYTAIVNRLFSYKRCLMCDDMTGEEADVSCGDARKKYGEDNTLVLSRNAGLTGLISDAIENGYLHLSRSLSADEVVSTQRRILQYKKGTIGPRLRFMKLFNRHIPECDDSIYTRFDPEKYQSFRTLFFITACLLTQVDFVRNKLLPFLPEYLLRYVASRIYP